MSVQPSSSCVMPPSPCNCTARHARKCFTDIAKCKSVRKHIALTCNCLHLSRPLRHTCSAIHSALPCCMQANQYHFFCTACSTSQHVSQGAYNPPAGSNAPVLACVEIHSAGLRAPEHHFLWPVNGQWQVRQQILVARGLGWRPHDTNCSALGDALDCLHGQLLEQRPCWPNGRRLHYDLDHAVPACCKIEAARYELASGIWQGAYTCRQELHTACRSLDWWLSCLSARELAAVLK